VNYLVAVEHLEAVNHPLAVPASVCRNKIKMKVLAAILLGLLVISLVVEDTEARTRRNCGKPNLPNCPVKKTYYRVGGDSVQERDQAPFEDAVNFLKEIEDKW